MCDIIMRCVQAVINAGGQIEKKSESGEDLEQLGEGKEGGKSDAVTGSIASSEGSEESNGATNDDIAIDSTVPLMSEEEEEETEEDVQVRKEADNIEKELTKQHKLRLLVSKGSMIIVSCGVLVVGVVLAAILHYDYSSCEFEDSLSVVVSPITAVYSTGSIAGTTAPLPTPTPTLD